MDLRPIRSTLLMILIVPGCGRTGATVPRLSESSPAVGWMLGPFAKPGEANPVITPSRSSLFRSPMTDTLVHWEEHATFNPAAVVKDGRVYLLYRAEDASGDMQIGRAVQGKKGCAHRP